MLIDLCSIISRIFKPFFGDYWLKHFSAIFKKGLFVFSKTLFDAMIFSEPYAVQFNKGVPECSIISRIFKSFFGDYWLKPFSAIF